MPAPEPGPAAFPTVGDRTDRTRAALPPPRQGEGHEAHPVRETLRHRRRPRRSRIAFWHYKGDTVRKWAGAEKGAAADRNAAVDAADFDALKNAPADAERGKGSEGVTGAALAGAGKLGRPLVVGINTWAGHAPGVVFNAGMDPSPASSWFFFWIRMTARSSCPVSTAAFSSASVWASSRVAFLRRSSMSSRAG